MQPVASRERVGSLTCVLVQGDAKPPKNVVVLCHGFGAPGDDLVTLGLEMMRMKETLRSETLFVFPEGPLSLAQQGMPEGRAWWLIDTARLAAIQRGDVEGAKRSLKEIPPGLEPARKAFSEMVDALVAKTKVPLKRFVFGGFSQGAMITTDYVLRMKENPAGLALMSGTLLNEDEWKKLAPARKGLRVVQSHGMQDPLLSYANAEALRDLLEAAGTKHFFVPFPGGHTITVEVLEKVAALVETAAGLP